jgi:hypothetical protein
VSLLKEVGRLGDMMGSNVVSRLAGSPDHELIVRVRLVFSLAVWGLAALGAFVRYRDGRRDLTLVLLAVTPLPLVALQSYGGELVLRLYLFTLPFAAFLIAGLVFGRPAGLPSILRSLFVFACIGVMAFGFLVARYGNERADAFTAAEVEGVRALYAMAPRGSLLLAATNNLPWEFQDLESYQYESFTDTVGVGVADITERIQTSTRPTFLILTRGQGIYAEAFAGLPAATWDAFVADVTASPHFRLVYRNADTSIFVPAGQAIPAAAP